MSTNRTNRDETQIPDEFMCPVGFELMQDPVVTEAGISYERAEIERWLTDHDTDPCTRSVLGSKRLTPNVQLRQAIERFLDTGEVDNGVAVPELVSWKTAGMGDCAFHAALGECSLAEFEYMHHREARDLVSNMIRKAVGLAPRELEDSSRVESIDSASINLRREDILGYIKRDLEQYIAKRNDMHDQSGRVSGLIDQYLDDSNSVDFDEIVADQEIMEIYASYVEQPGMWLNHEYLGLIAICFNISIDFYRTPEFRRDESGSSLENSESGISMFALVEKFNESENGIVRHVRYNNCNHFERLVSQEEMFQIIKKINEEKDKAEELKNQSTQSIDLTQVPKQLKCCHCNDLLIKPIVKHGNNDFSDQPYLHESCFELFKEEHPCERIEISVSDEVMLNEMFKIFGLNLEDMGQNEESDRIYKTMIKLNHTLNHFHDEKNNFSSLGSVINFENEAKLRKAQKLFTFINRQKTVVGQDMRMHFDYVVPKQVKYLAEDSKRKNFDIASNAYTRARTGVALGTVGTAALEYSIYSGVLTTETLGYTIMNAISTSAAQAGSEAAVATTAGTIARCVVPGLAIAGVALYFATWRASAQAEEFGDQLNEVFDLLSGNKDSSISKEERFNRVESKLNAIFNKNAFDAFLRTFVLDKQSYAFAHLLRGYNALQRGAVGDIDLAHDELIRAYNDAKNAKDSSLKAICAMSLAEIWFDTYRDPNKECPSTVRSGKSLRKAAENKSLRRVKRGEFDHWVEEYSKSHEMMSAMKGMLDNNVNGLFNALVTRRSPSKEQRDNIEWLVNFKNDFLIHRVDTHGFWPLFSHFMQGYAWLVAKMYDLNVSYDGDIVGDERDKVTNAAKIFERCCDEIKKIKNNPNLTQREYQLICLMREFIHQTFIKLYDEGVYPNAITRSEKTKEEWLIDLNLMSRVSNVLDEESKAGDEESKASEEAGDLNFSEIISNSSQSLMSTQITNLDQVLGEILSSEDFATTEFTNGASWLHYLAEIAHEPAYQSRVKDAVRRICELGVSPYQRDMSGRTPFCYLRDNNDPYSLASILRSDDLSNEYLGLDAQAAAIQKAITNVKNNSKDASHFIMLSGPPGVGKTQLVNALFQKEGFDTFELEHGSADDMWVGQQQRRLRDFFRSSGNSRRKPVCLLLDEIDVWCSSTSGSGVNDSHREEVTRLIQKEIDKLKGRRVIAVGITNHIDRLDTAILRRAGAPILFELPKHKDRERFFADRFRMFDMPNEWISRLSEASCGWAYSHLSRYIDDVGEVVDEENLKEHFNAMVENISHAFVSKYGVSVKMPSLMLSVEEGDGNIVYPEKTQKVLDKAKDFINDSEKYLSRLDGGQVNILLYGPPGTGKTSFARLLSQQTGAAFVHIDAGSIVNPIELQRKLDTVRLFDKSVLFIDEIDALMPFSAILQTSIDGFSASQDSGACLVVAATNYPQLLTDPMKDRFFSKVKIELPDPNSRCKIIRNHLEKLRNKGMEVSENLMSTQTVSYFSRQMEGFSCRKIALLFHGLTVDLTFVNAALTGGRLRDAIRNLSDSDANPGIFSRHGDASSFFSSESGDDNSEYEDESLETKCSA
ncbi:MAG: AAA family ATPase [Gammaproteobacteria bacterium]